MPHRHRDRRPFAVVSRQLSELGHEVIVANARNVHLICESTRKDDRLDAKTLARLARIDPALLCPVRHHSAAGQAQLSVIRARAVLVSARTALVNAARGLAKPHGERLRRCGTQQFGRAMASEVSAELRTALEPLLTAVEGLTEQIQVYDRRIEEIAPQHPEIRGLKQVDGVGTLIALSYVLTTEDPHRFRRSRDVGCFFGLRSGRKNSGDSQPQLHISKEGDRYLHTLMVPNLDPDQGRLRIIRSVEQTKGHITVKEPKGKRSRNVILSSFVLEGLDAHKKAQGEIRKSLGPDYRDGDLICPRPDGSLWTRSAFTSSYRDLLRRRNLAGPNFHALHHSHASLCLRNGVDVKEVGDRLGHSRASFTLDTYVHLLPGPDKEVARRVDRVLRKAIEKTRHPNLI